MANNESAVKPETSRGIIKMLIERVILADRGNNFNIRKLHGITYVYFGVLSVLNIDGGIGFVIADEEAKGMPGYVGTVHLVYPLTDEGERVYREDDQDYRTVSCGREYRGLKAFMSDMIEYAAFDAADLTIEMLLQEAA